ncbi:hypothetical protein F2P81_013092 [Scophthalmus maximus]|uniref:Uncharacterized protein n=1 Tax=Scophthalmus maximus TaxID=52904 RepID=A0A6A4SWA2_SCOMX|nr:hypothetical protein F2P81_013092 [Scophthalmus maximus]
MKKQRNRSLCSALVRRRRFLEVTLVRWGCLDMFLALSHSHSFCVFFCLISGPNGNLDLLDVPAFTNDCRDSSGVDVGSSASPRDLWPLCSSVEMFHQDRGPLKRWKGNRSPRWLSDREPKINSEEGKPPRVSADRCCWARHTQEGCCCHTQMHESVNLSGPTTNLSCQYLSPPLHEMHLLARCYVAIKQDQTFLVAVPAAGALSAGRTARAGAERRPAVRFTAAASVHRINRTLNRTLVDSAGVQPNTLTSLVYRNFTSETAN